MSLTKEEKIINWVRKNKKYQYLYLKEKINHRNTKDQYSNLHTEYWDNLGSGLSLEHRTEADQENEKSEERTNHLIKWLKKIKKKYNYDKTYSKNY